MDIIELNADNVEKEITNIITNQKECVVYGIPNKNYVFVGRNTEDQYNKQYCIENDIGLLEFPNEGGIIVLSEGDFEIGFFSKEIENRFNYNFANVVVEFLKSKNINIKLIGNDMMIDEIYKCGSFSSRRYGDIIYSAFHVSIGMDLDLIKNICTKPMVKIPKGLSEYGVTTDEIKYLFFNFLKQVIS